MGEIVKHGIWMIREDETVIQDVAVELREENYGRGFPKGRRGEIIKGYSFFSLDPAYKENNGYITSRIIDEPVLEAVTEAQRKKWSDKRIFAKPATFTWKKE